MTNYSIYIGCDISKAVIDVSYHYRGQAIYLAQFKNSEKGFKAFRKALTKRIDEPSHVWFVCFENTGVYSKPLLNWLATNDIACKEESALKIFRSLGLRRGKDDKVDSMDICQYAFEKRDSIKPTILPSAMIIKLRKLLARRDFLVRQRQSLKVSLKEQKGFIDEGLYDSLKSGNERLIQAYNSEIKAIELSIKEVIGSDPQIARNDELARSVIGIGTITSAYMIATTENFKVFNNARKYACYCGVAPFPNQSGIRRGYTKVSHIANKKMKSLFSNCILSAITNDPEISRYYERKKEEGKRPGIVFNAIKNKLIHRVFAVIERQTPYVKIMNYT